MVLFLVSLPKYTVNDSCFNVTCGEFRKNILHRVYLNKGGAFTKVSQQSAKCYTMDVAAHYGDTFVFKMVN